MEKEHKYWVDWMKAAGMLLIIWGHSFPETFTPFIYSFSVPLFFIISGYLFKRSQTFSIFFRKNLASLIVPYLILCLIKDFSHITKYYNDIPELLKLPIGVLGGFHTYLEAPAAKNLWFVYTLFIIKVIFQISNDNKKVLLSLTALCIAGAMICGFHDYHPMWGVTNTFLALPYFLTGYAVSINFKGKLPKLIERIKSSNRILAVSGIVLLLVIQFLLSELNGPAWMYKGGYGNNILLFYILGFTGTVTSFLISALLDNVRVKAIGMISIGTMVILQFHRDLYYPLGKLVKEFAMGNISEGVLSFIASAVVLVAFIPIIMLLQRYFPIMIGKRKYKQ